MTIILTLLADSKSDRELREKADTPLSEPVVITHANGFDFHVFTCRGLRRAIGRKHGKTVRYWLTDAEGRDLS